MSILDISKVSGAIISVTFISIYYNWWLPFVHRLYFGFNPEYGIGTELIFYGIILTQTLIPRPGQRVRLVFMGFVLECEWAGPGLLPNIGHFTIFVFGFPLLWGIVAIKNDTYEYPDERGVHIDVSDHRTKYNVNSSLPYWAAMSSRIIGIILELLFVRWTRAPREYKLAAFGYALYVAGIIMVCSNSLTTAAKNKLNGAVISPVTASAPREETIAPKPTPTAPSKEENRPLVTPQQEASAMGRRYPNLPDYAKNNVPFSHDGTLYNLMEYRRPVFIPDPRWFTPITPGPLGRMSDGVTYYTLEMDNEGRPFQIFHTRGVTVCLIVPKGSVGAVQSATPPKFVINLQHEVQIGLQAGNPTHRERSPRDLPNGFWKDETTWKVLHDMWGEHVNRLGERMMDPNQRGLVFYVKGPAKDQVLNPALNGGLVCF